ncbi:MAG: type II secretion system protein [Bacteroidales bacterium]|nr:type II secretion system protein [Bacteroidales bacterium]
MKRLANSTTLRSRLYSHRLKAYTLQEVLVVLVIIGILVLIALPNLLPLISRAKATEAQLQLEHVYTLEKSYFYMYSKYSTDLQAIGFEHEKLSSEGGRANYRIEVMNASNNSFLARATAIVDFDGDGTFDVWEIDQDKNLKQIVKD